MKILYSKLCPERKRRPSPGKLGACPGFQGINPAAPCGPTSSLAKPVPHLMRELVRTQEYLRASEPSQFNQTVDQAIERMGSQLEKNKYFFLLKRVLVP
jgi:hypothetical protein